MVKLRRIRIENFTILKEIMGKDSLEINFTDNPICIIIGKNGSGKSFLMGTLSPTSFDLIKNRATSDVAPEVLIPLSVILLVAGGLICIVSVVDLFQGRYVGGKGDPEVIEATRIARETQNASDSFGNPKTDEEAETEK